MPHLTYDLSGLSGPFVVQGLCLYFNGPVIQELACSSRASFFSHSFG